MPNKVLEAMLKFNGFSGRQFSADFDFSAPDVPHHGDIWMHHSGRKYRIEALANQQTSNPTKFPPMVVYRSCANGFMWTRPLHEFVDKFTLLHRPWS